LISAVSKILQEVIVNPLRNSLRVKLRIYLMLLGILREKLYWGDLLLVAAGFASGKRVLKRTPSYRHVSAKAPPAIFT
jgi:hypothetical protein